MENAYKVSRTTHLFFFLLTATFVAFGVWAYTGTLDVVSMAQGEVIPSGKVKQVQHLEGGIIREIKVSEGDQVMQGQSLVELEQIRSGTSMEEMDMRVNTLSVDVLRLTSQLSGKTDINFPPEIARSNPQLASEAQALFKTQIQSHLSTMSKLDTTIRQREQHIKTLKAQLANKLERLPLLEEELALSEELLADNLTTRIKHLGILNRQKEIQGKIIKDQSALKEAKHALFESQARRKETEHKFKEDTAERLKSVKEELKETNIRRKKVKDSLERTVIRAPITGVIKRLYKVTKGGVVKPGDTLADIVPTQDSLVIEARLDISDIGYISQGQPVFIRLPNKDSAKFGKIQGKIAGISPDTFTDDLGMTFYRIRIESTQHFFTAGTQKYSLYPGMVVAVYIRIGERTIMEYLLDPFISTLSFSLQER